MTISYETTLEQALEEVDFNSSKGILLEFVIWEKEEFPGWGGGLRKVVDDYQRVKDEILTLLNSQYSAKTGRPFRHKTLPLEDVTDEPGCFLWEAGSNAGSYSEFTALYRVNLWMGASGFELD